MGIKDFEINFYLIRESKRISCQRKKEIFITFLYEIEELFLIAPDYKNSSEQENAKKLYKKIKDFLN